MGEQRLEVPDKELDESSLPPALFGMAKEIKLEFVADDECGTAGGRGEILNLLIDGIVRSMLVARAAVAELA